VTREYAAEVPLAHAQPGGQRGSRVVAARVRRHRGEGRGERGRVGGVDVHRPIVRTPHLRPQ
jgi:hypothetical protein